MKKTKKKKTQSSSKSAGKKASGRQSAKKGAGKLWEFKDFLSMKEMRREELEELFRLADRMKKGPEVFYGKLKGRSLVMLF